jgi:Tol biopolymer transport system component/DNA-binding winged helix-turn-helix (wHTH) protein
LKNKRIENVRDESNPSTDHDFLGSEFTLGDWVVLPELNRLRLRSGDGNEEQLEPRLMDLLIHLCRGGERVFNRRELLDEVWKDQVVNEEALTRAVSELRRVLGDDRTAPRYIETIRKGGYRLLARPEAGGSAPVTSEPATAPAVPGRKSRSGLLFLAASVLATLAILYLYSGRGEDRQAVPEPLLSVPLTTFEGSEQMPALSPDGSMVAFCWNGPDEDNMDIYLQQIGEAAPLRLTFDEGYDVYPVWTPDGSISYIHDAGTESSIFTVPLLGGEPRLVMSARHGIRGLSWTPDGRLVYADLPAEDAASRLYIRDLQSGHDVMIVDGPADRGDVMPRVSPDGTTIAFLRQHRTGREDIHVVAVDGGEARLLSDQLGSLEGLAWAADGRSLVCASRMNGNFSLWRIDLANGEPTWLPVHGEWMFFPSVSRNGERLVYEHRWYEKNVWQIEREIAPGAGVATSPLITSSRWDCESRISPDDGRLAFISSRSGFLELWCCQPDGTRPTRLSHFDGPSVTYPAWSHQGGTIAVCASPEGYSNLFLADPDTRELVRVTRGEFHDITPAWSHDDRWLYFGSDRGGEWGLWRIESTAREDQEPQPLPTLEGAVRARLTPDGRELWYTRKNTAGLWRVELQDGMPAGEPIQVLTDLPRRWDWHNWDLWSGGLVFVDRNEEGTVLVDYSFATGQLTPLAQIPGLANPSLAVSPDGKKILYARIERSIRDLMLVEGFK